MAEPDLSPQVGTAEAEEDDLYSRQRYAYGEGSSTALFSSSVLVSGLCGVGCEVAKNLVLSGIGTVTLHQPTCVHPWAPPTFATGDSGCAPEEVAGKLSTALRVMGPGRNIRIHTGELTPEVVAAHTAVCLCGAYRATDAGRIDAMCREIATVRFSGDEKMLADAAAKAPQDGREAGPVDVTRGVAFVLARTEGPFGEIFADAGACFVSTDPEGIEEVPLPIVSITCRPAPTTSTRSALCHASNDEDGLVTVDGVLGSINFGDEGWKGSMEKCSQLNARARRHSPSAIQENCPSGYVSRLTKAQTFNCPSLQQLLDNPEFNMWDLAQFDRPAEVHAAFRALEEFESTNGRFVRRSVPQDIAADTSIPDERKRTRAIEEDLAAVVQLAKAKNPDADERIVRILAESSGGCVPSVDTIVSGVAAQEVIKACVGKFTPMTQWLYIDCLDILEAPPDLPEGGHHPGEGLAVLPDILTDRLRSLRLLLVGAGALGCEYLKLFALMGIGTEGRGKILVVDMDHIEKSNLSRQFLFHFNDIGAKKCDVAVHRAKEINPKLNIGSLCIKICDENEAELGADFWPSFDVVIMALDNVAAREYVDQRCIDFCIPMMDSGTKGMMGHTQVVVPRVTQAYSDTKDPEDAAIMMCTLHFFPNNTNHTVQYALFNFERLFSDMPTWVNTCLTDVDDWSSHAEELPPDHVRCVFGMITRAPTTIFDCVKVSPFVIWVGDLVVQWARMELEESFRLFILNLLHTHPPGEIVKDKPFWGGARRVPTALRFDATNKSHMRFVKSAAILRAIAFGLKGEAMRGMNDDAAMAAAAAVPPPPSSFSVDRVNAQSVPEPEHIPMILNIPLDEDAAEAVREREPTPPPTGPSEWLTRDLPALVAAIKAAAPNFKFDKDDKTMGHLDFIESAAALRAFNYGIPAADRAQARQLAGRIIPAVITTTATVTGVATTELYRIVAGKPFEQLKMGFLNLAQNMLLLSEPSPAIQKLYLPQDGTNTEDPLYGKTFTRWDRLRVRVRDDKSIGALRQLVKAKFHLVMTSLVCGASVLWDEDLTSERYLQFPVMGFIKAKGFNVVGKYVDLTINCKSTSDVDIVGGVPPLRYQVG